MKRAAKVCDKDCLHCPFEDCINDALDYDDYKAEAAVEELLRPKTARQKRLAAQQRAYREANREKVAAQQRAYREANREKVAAQQRAYYEANREKVAAQQRAYYEANRESSDVRRKADLLRAWRKAHGYTQRALAKLCGVDHTLISHAEAARIPLPAAVAAMMGGAST